MVIPWARMVCLIYTPAEAVYIRQTTSAPGIINIYQLMCNHVWVNQHNNSSMDSLYLYRDLLDCIVGFNLMIKCFYDVILKPTIKSLLYKGLINAKSKHQLNICNAAWMTSSHAHPIHLQHCDLNDKMMKMFL